MEEYIFELGEIEQEVVDAVDDKLLKFITSKTLDLIEEMENKVCKGVDEIYSEFDDFMNVVQNTVELAFACVNAKENTMPIAVARIAVSLSGILYTIKNLRYLNFDDSDKHVYMVDSLYRLVKVLSLGYHFERKNHFSLEDIAEFRKEMEQLNKERRSFKFKQDLKQPEKTEQDEIIDKWLLKNAVKDYNFSVLKEECYEALKVALEEGKKTIAISWIQRRLKIGYPRAAKIVDHLEENGVISTQEEALSLGVKGGRIIKVTYNQA